MLIVYMRQLVHLLSATHPLPEQFHRMLLKNLLISLLVLIVAAKNASQNANR